MAEHRKAEIHYIVINGEQHMADSSVCRYVDSLEEQLQDEQAKHTQFVESVNADVNKQAERIMLNLASGMQESDNCLKHSLNHFEKVDPVSGEPVFAFQHEVKRRIALALAGKTANGTDYTR